MKNEKKEFIAGVLLLLSFAAWTVFIREASKNTVFVFMKNNRVIKAIYHTGRWSFSKEATDDVV